jgi:hypothetical protein
VRVSVEEPTFEERIAAAVAGLAMIDRAGGLAGRAELAERWGVSPSRIRQMTQREDFPVPALVVGGNVPVWFAASADAWRAAQPGSGRRPRADGH